MYLALAFGIFEPQKRKAQIYAKTLSRTVQKKCLLCVYLYRQTTSFGLMAEIHVSTENVRLRASETGSEG